MCAGCHGNVTPREHKLIRDPGALSRAWGARPVGPPRLPPQAQPRFPVRAAFLFPWVPHLRGELHTWRTAAPPIPLQGACAPLSLLPAPPHLAASTPPPRCPGVHSSFTESGTREVPGCPSHSVPPLGVRCPWRGQRAVRPAPRGFQAVALPPRWLFEGILLATVPDNKARAPQEFTCALLYFAGFYEHRVTC